jgi:hypothetical protein
LGGCDVVLAPENLMLPEMTGMLNSLGELGAQNVGSRMLDLGCGVEILVVAILSYELVSGMG